MSDDPFAALPDASRQIAHSAMAAVIGSSASPAVRSLAGGKSGAFVFLVESGNHRFVLRIEGHPSPLRNPHQYISMQIAAEGGIGPPVRYIDADNRVVMTDFIEDRPLQAYPGGGEGLARAIGSMLRELQALPAFPGFVDFPAIVCRLWTHVCRTGLFADGLLDAASQRLREICNAYVLQPQDYVASHNDVLPRNVLFDGARLWLIDWESSYRNDPLVDLATALDNFAPSPQLEELLMLAWLGQTPGHVLRSRLALVRAMTRLYYAGVLFSAAVLAPRSRPDQSLSAPTHLEFERAIRDMRLLAETPEAGLVLGKMFLASFLSGSPPPGLPPMYMR